MVRAMELKQGEAHYRDAIYSIPCVSDMFIKVMIATSHVNMEASQLLCQARLELRSGLDLCPFLLAVLILRNVYWSR